MVQTDNPMPTPATDPVAQIPPKEAAELTQQQQWACWVKIQIRGQTAYETGNRSTRFADPHGP